MVEAIWLANETTAVNQRSELLLSSRFQVEYFKFTFQSENEDLLPDFSMKSGSRKHISSHIYDYETKSWKLAVETL